MYVALLSACRLLPAACCASATTFLTHLSSSGASDSTFPSRTALICARQRLAKSSRYRHRSLLLLLRKFADTPVATLQPTNQSIDQAVPDDRLLLESDQDSLARALPEILELCKIGTSLLPIAWFAPATPDTTIASLHIFLSLHSAVAEEKGWSIEQVAQITCDNAERFFNAGSHSLPDISTVEQESPRHE